ncbi:MAG: deoxyribonuclease IV [Spirochaetia bacterium]|nr:deoxyribonuclease IV [Spirochaetia bacterium]
MMFIGCHLSSTKGFLAMGETALSIGANTFAFFTRNPRGGAAKELDSEDAHALTELCKAEGFGPLVAHAPYTMNLCSADEGIRGFAADMLREDILRMEALPGNYYNFHPGSHTGQGVEVGIDFIAEALRSVLPLAEHTTILLETMAGKGSEVGRRFEELKEIIDRVEGTASVSSESPVQGAPVPRLGVCIDTCHLHDGGYDIVHDLDAVLNEFDNIIGLDRLKACHLNDSMNDAGSRKDRHAKIGEGHIGLEALTAVINHPVLKNLPFILETPNELPGYAKEIALLRSLRQ